MLVDRIGDGSEGHLLGGMGGMMACGGDPSNEFGWDGDRI